MRTVRKNPPAIVAAAAPVGAAQRTRILPRSRASLIGATLLGTLWISSFGLSHWRGATVLHCPLGRDLLRPDQTVCELAFGGLWVSLSLGLAAGALSTSLGLLLAVFARSAGGAVDRWSMRLADAFFSLPDVLVLMVVQFAGQTLGDLDPRLHVPPPLLMVLSLAIVGWSGPARMLRNRLETLEQQDFVRAAKALGSGRWHLIRRHLWPNLREYTGAIFLSRVPAAVLAESTVSFFGIARMEPMSLGRYLGTSYSSLLYPSGARIVLPAWGMLVLIVLAASLAASGKRSQAA